MAEELVTRRVGRVLIGRRGHVVEVRVGEAPIGFWRVMGYVSLLMVILLGLLVVGCVARTGGWGAWGDVLFCVYIALPAVATMVWCISRLEELLSGSRGFWMRVSPAGVVYRSMAATHFLSPSNAVDIEVRKYGAFEPWHLVAHSERFRHHRQFILSGARPEMEAVAEAMRPCLGLPKDPFRRAEYGRGVAMSWTLRRWTVDPGLQGVHLHSLSWLALGAGVLSATVMVLSVDVIARHWPDEISSVAHISALGMAIACVFALYDAAHFGIYLDADGLVAWRGRRYLRRSEIFGSSVAGFIVEGRELFVADDKMNWERVARFPSRRMAQWVYHKLEIGLVSLRFPRVAPAEFEPLRDVNVVALPPGWADQVMASPEVSERWGERYAQLVAGWRAMYASDRRWWRRFVEGMPLHVRGRRAARRKLRT